MISSQSEKGRPCADEKKWKLCWCHNPAKCAEMIFKKGEGFVQRDKDGWPKMTWERRQLWYGGLMKRTSDEALVRLLLTVPVREGLHEKAPWAFDVEGYVYEEYLHIDIMARERGYGTGTIIVRVDDPCWDRKALK